MTAFEDGEKLLNTFFNKRVFSNELPFDSRMPKNGRKNFNTALHSDNVSHKASKTVIMENSAMCNVVSLCIEKHLSFEDVMENRVTEECLSIFNPNGTLVKVQQSTLFHNLNKVPLSIDYCSKTISIVDMGFL